MKHTHTHAHVQFSASRCLSLPFFLCFTHADFSKVVEIVRYAREMMADTDDGSCCNQPHCLTGVVLPACLGGG